jgi:hypothetical protein
MADYGYPVTRHDSASESEELKRIDAAMDDAPRGALLLSLVAVAGLLIGWLGLYLLVFLPRGTVG